MDEDKHTIAFGFITFGFCAIIVALAFSVFESHKKVTDLTLKLLDESEKSHALESLRKSPQTQRIRRDYRLGLEVMAELRNASGLDLGGEWNDFRARRPGGDRMMSEQAVNGTVRRERGPLPVRNSSKDNHNDGHGHGHGDRATTTGVANQIKSGVTTVRTRVAEAVKTSVAVLASTGAAISGVAVKRFQKVKELFVGRRKVKSELPIAQMREWQLLETGNGDVESFNSESFISDSETTLIPESIVEKPQTTLRVTVAPRNA